MKDGSGDREPLSIRALLGNMAVDSYTRDFER
jgi:hypothetical protein